MGMGNIRKYDGGMTDTEGFKYQHFVLQYLLYHSSFTHYTCVPSLPFCDWLVHPSIPCFFTLTTVHLSYTVVAR